MTAANKYSIPFDHHNMDKSRDNLRHKLWITFLLSTTFFPPLKNRDINHVIIQL